MSEQVDEAAQVGIAPPLMIRIPALRLASVILVIGLSAVFLAQTDAEPGWIGSTTTRVKPEMRKEFEFFSSRSWRLTRKQGSVVSYAAELRRRHNGIYDRRARDEIRGPGRPADCREGAG